MSSHYLLKRMTTPLLLIGLAANGAAMAQETNASAAAETASVTLETIVVTAGKRQESQRELAGTVSVLQGSDLERQGLKDQEDLFKRTPGVQFNKGDPDRSLPTIRGIGSVTSANALALQQATTGLYIEDVPFTDPFGFVSTADLAPFDLERVEVLRGPQGALYGSSSLGGAIRYLTNKPDLTSADFSVLSSVSSPAGGDLDHSIYAMGNFPLIADKAAVRAVAFDRKDAGYVDNLGTGQREANELRQRGGRLLGKFAPTDTTTVTAMFLTQETEIDDTFAVSPDPNRLEIATPTASPRTNKYSFGNVQADVQLGGNVLTSNTGYFEKQSRSAQDQTRRFGGIGALLDPDLPALPAVSGPTLTQGDSFSQEFRLASAAGALLNYVAGVFYQRTTYDIDATWTTPGAGALWGPIGEMFLPGDVLTREVDSATATEKAVFADAEYVFDSGFSLGLGGRYYRNDLNYEVDSVFLTDPLVASQSMSEDGFTPKLNVKYRFGDHMWYALASKGYRFGGVNVNPPTFSSYDSDSLWNYESGLRLAPAPNLLVDASVFVLDWRDAQVNAITPGVVPLNGIANVGKARVEGAELSVVWSPIRDLNLTAALAYTDAKTEVAFTSNGGVMVPSGSRLPGTPDFQSTVQGTYDFTGPLGTSGQLSVTHAYVGDRVFTIEGDAAASSYSTVDVRLAFKKNQWGMGFFVNNVGDERGVTGAQRVNAFGAPGYTDYYLIRPRVAGLSLSYDMSL